MTLHPEPPQPGASTPTRTLSAADLAVFLRIVVGLPVSEGGAEANPTRYTIDAHAWIAWSLAGLPVCAVPSGAAVDHGAVVDHEAVVVRATTVDHETAVVQATTADDEPTMPWVPQVHDAIEAARHFAAQLAVDRHDGNITKAALAMETSRRALREMLKRGGLYQHTIAMRKSRRRAIRASRSKAFEILAKLRRGMSEASIATALGRMVRVRSVDKSAQIEIEGEAPMDVGRLGSAEAIRGVTEALARFGGPAGEAHDDERPHDGDAHGENGGTDAI